MQSNRRIRKALYISFAVSLISLLIKSGGYFITGSTTALADAAESVVHVIAVAFVVYGFLLSKKPADAKHLYGHERVEFLSIGVEGAVITLAGLTIIWQAVNNYITGFQLSNLGEGMIVMGAAGLINLILGIYVLRVGRSEKNMLAVSNGKHVLTDVWTTAGVIMTLLIIELTGWVYLDILISFAVALYIIREAYKLLSYAIDGIMDSRHPEVDKALRQELSKSLPGRIKSWHHLRHRTSGQTTWVELHVIFDKEISLKEAHDDATLLERKLIDALDSDAVVTIHPEPEEPHDKMHEALKGANKNRNLDEFI
jgi:cation diffusion facilitator family transporter